MWYIPNSALAVHTIRFEWTVVWSEIQWFSSLFMILFVAPGNTTVMSNTNLNSTSNGYIIGTINQFLHWRLCQWLDILMEKSISSFSLTITQPSQPLPNHSMALISCDFALLYHIPSIPLRHHCMKNPMELMGTKMHILYNKCSFDLYTSLK